MLSPGIHPSLFPVRFAHRFGGFQPPCPEAHDAKPGVSPFPIATAGNPLVRLVKIHPQLRVQGGHRPGRVRGKAPPVP